METSAKRIASRRSDQIPILFAEHNAKNYIPAMMVNSSSDGMCFEAKSPLQPDTDLFIKIQDNASDGLFSEKYKSFRAEVKWCRQLADRNGSVYGVGVKYLAKSHLTYGLNLPDTADFCDCCEIRSSGFSMHKAESGLMLCAECLSHMENKPPKIEAVLERFFIGNVV